MIAFRESIMHNIYLVILIPLLWMLIFGSSEAQTAQGNVSFHLGHFGSASYYIVRDLSFAVHYDLTKSHFKIFL